MHIYNKLVQYLNCLRCVIKHLNVSKTKEMCIDFRRNINVISPIIINGEPVEQVDSFKYLGVILDEKNSFTEHVTKEVSAATARSSKVTSFLC